MNETRRSKTVSLIATVFVGVFAVFVSSFASRSADDDRGILSRLLSRALSTPTSQVSIGSIRGALSSNATINNITIADRDGVWLQVDQVRLVWRRTALLLRRLEVDRLEIGKLKILRRPVASDETVPDADQPLLPELPVRVNVREFVLGELALGTAVAGIEARLTATGAVTLGNPSQGLNFQFDARRLDADGTLSAELKLVPKTERLDLKLVVREPARGILVHALNVPNLPPAMLDLNGSGSLDDFRARLAFEVGAGNAGAGSATLRRDADGRHLALKLDARIEGLLPSLAAPVFAGTTNLDGDIVFDPDGGIKVSRLAIASQTARLDVLGSLSGDQVADLKISARALPNAGTMTSAKDVSIGKFAFDAAVTGPIATPRIDAVLDANQIKSPDGQVEKISARLLSSPSSGNAATSDLIQFTANAEASGLSLSDPGLNRALGGIVSLNLAGNLKNGVADLRTANLRTSTAEFRFNGQIGRPVVRGQLTVSAPDLTRFGELASLELRGALNAAFNLSGIPKEGRIDAIVDGRATKVSTGIAALDGLFGGRANVNGTIRKLPRGGFGFIDLRLVGAHVSARADGEATRRQANIDLQIDIPDLSHADSRLSGRAAAQSKLSGSLEPLNVTARIFASDMRALGRPIRQLTIEANASDVLRALDARVVLSGTVDGKPARGAVRLAKQPSGGWRLDDLDLKVGTVAAQGEFAVSPDRIAVGQLTIDARDLNDLSPLALTKMAGALRANATLSGADGKQNGAVAADGRNIRFGSSSIERLSAKAEVTDIYARPVLNGEIAIRRARIGDETISDIKLMARGTAEASDITLSAEARGFAVDAAGRLVVAAPLRLELATLKGRQGQHRVALLQPATISFAKQGIGIRSLKLSLGRGRLSVDGRVGDSIDVSVLAQSLPLSVASIAMPNLGLAGTLNGDAKLSGSTKALTGTWRARVDGLVLPQTRDLGLTGLDITASGQLANQRSTIDATVRGVGSGTVRVRGSLPVQGDRLDLSVQGLIDLGLANRTLSPTGRRVTGNVDVDLRIGGTIPQPNINGTARVSGGGYQDSELGLQLTNIRGRVVTRGTDIRLDQLTAQTPNGGTISAQGNVRIDQSAGFPGNLRITGQRAKLTDSESVTTVANLSMVLSGPLARQPRISGQVDVVSLDIKIPERLPRTLRPITNTSHVGAPPTAAARIALQAKQNQRGRRASPFDATLDIAISAPNRVFVRGRGIDAELGGNIRVRGQLADPLTTGAFQLRRGRMNLAGTRLDFTRGRIIFVGNLTPDLDLVAQTSAGGVTATIDITGPATQPKFAFSSTPELPQEEILSRILFSKASGGLSPGQALQVAQVAAQFSGSGSDVFERMRRSLGVDNIDISVGADGSTSVGVSRAINRRISVGVKTGTRPENSAVSVDIDVTKNLRLQGEVNREGGTAVGVGMEWEY